MIERNYNNRNTKITAVILILVMIFTMFPASISYATTAYDFQPAVGDDINKIKMLSPSDITVEQDGDPYINRINGDIDGTGEDGIRFTFTMAAGMNNFSEDVFTTYNMPLIKIYDAQGNIAAQYSDGSGDLKFLGSKKSGETNKQGTQKTSEVYIGVAHGVLGTGDYILEFEAGVRSNNESKILGDDVRFKFHVKAAPDISEMIRQAEDFANEAQAAGKIHDTNPGCYPQAAFDTLQQAIADAKAAQEAGLGTEEAADQLYKALKTFKDSKNFNISSIAISGIGKQITVGDSGKATAAVTVNPDEDQYKKVKWSAVREPKEGAEPADNLQIDELTGKWIAAYEGTVYLKAAPVKAPQQAEYYPVTITSPEGMIAINLTNKTTRVKTLVDKMGGSGSLTAIKVFTSNSGMVTEEDIAYLNGIKTLKTLDLSKANLTGLENNSFKEHPALEKVALPETLTQIGSRAFYNCKKLKTLELPASVTSIGGGAFAGCTALNATMKMRAVYPPEYAVNSTYGDSFDGLSTDQKAAVTTIEVPYGCTADYKAKQGWRSFRITETEQQTLQVNLTKSGTLEQAAEAALTAGGLEEEQVTDLAISSPDGVYMTRAEDMNKYLQSHFRYITTLDLSETRFENDKCNATTFKNRISIKKIILPESTTNLGGSSFAGCKNLRELVLPKGLTHIGNGAFTGCSLLPERIVVNAKEPPGYDGVVFPPQVKTLLVPPASVDAYKAAREYQGYTILSQVSIALDASAITLEVSNSKSLTATLTDYGENGTMVFWSSSNTKVASLSAKTGKTVKVSGLKAGTATITAKDATGVVAASCKVTVKNLPAPTVKVASAGYNKVKITWSGVKGTKGYRVYRCSKSGKIQKYWSLTSSARSLTNTGLVTGSTYYYKVRAYKTVGKTNYWGDYSKLKYAKPIPAAVSGVKASKGGSKRIKVSWKKTSGSSGYAVVRSTSKTKGYKTVKIIKSGSTVKYTTGKLTKGKRYYFKVRAYRTVKGKRIYGPYSSVVSYIAK